MEKARRERVERRTAESIVMVLVDWLRWWCCGRWLRSGRRRPPSYLPPTSLGTQKSIFLIPPDFFPRILTLTRQLLRHVLRPPCLRKLTQPKHEFSGTIPGLTTTTAGPSSRLPRSPVLRRECRSQGSVPAGPLEGEGTADSGKEDLVQDLYLKELKAYKPSAAVSLPLLGPLRPRPS